MDLQIADEVKVERLARLQSLLRQQQAAFNQSQIGRTMPILLEKKGRKAGQLAGRSPYLQAVHVECDETRIGEIALTRITSAGANSLSGVIMAMIDSDSIRVEPAASEQSDGAPKANLSMSG
jgi:tRNA-2-methylthio-N6-dimethylallyladenosine synthase